MGYRLRWIAIADATPEDACAVLGFAQTGEMMPEDANRMRHMPLGAFLPRHYLIMDDGRPSWRHVRDEQLAAASRRFELLVCFIFDVCSATEAALWRDGECVWRLTFDGSLGEDAELVVTGHPPDQLAAWKAASRATSENEYDATYEVALRASAELIGFEPNDERPIAFELLKRPVHPLTTVGGWFARLFGRG